MGQGVPKRRRRKTRKDIEMAEFTQHTSFFITESHALTAKDKTEFIQHIPGIVKDEDEKFEFTNFKREVLGKYNHLVESGEYHWCYMPWDNDLQYLMINTKNDDEWRVVGFVRGYDLARHLPKIVFNQRIIVK